MYYIITREDCIWCDKAKQFLEENGEGYQAFLYSDNPMIIKLMIKAGLKTVPQVWYHNTYVGGYEDLVAFHKEETTQ